MTDAVSPQAVRAERAFTVDAVAESLARRISDGEFEMGAWIRQAKLAEEYGVSRTPATLALSRLEALGVVERIANRGFRVRLPSARDVAEVIEVRGLLEGHAAYLAAQRASAEQLGRLHRAVEQFREVVSGLRAGRSEEWARARWHAANALFHATVFEAAGNGQLTTSSELLHHRLPRNTSWSAMQGDVRLLSQNANEHEAIALAIELHDGARARNLAFAHLETARDLMVARLQELA
ncbi:GntR family transcriptional regulator [Paractinoplanes deccanensis]|uniref:GntR family transcriptional regulator n=1 Tax=Paractinoplanes deccanensis TaxID=113561 RepID=A0ABQ3XZ47_9ACTN|nr:GntR family transcriptional regulator [Actinoplanes deccanensis]GID73032.1 GntR family transcriptional regulator [Actinoplanes deccanensis]